MRRRSRTPTPPERSWAGGCAVHSSASESTSRSISSTAVLAGAGRARPARAARLHLRRLGRDLAERAVTAQREADLAGQLDGARVEGDEQAARDQPAWRRHVRVGEWALRTRPTGGPAARRSSTSRSAGSTAAISSASRAGSRSTAATEAPARGWAAGGRPSERSTGASDDVGDRGEQGGRGTAEAGGIGAERFAHGGEQAQVLVRRPTPGRACAARRRASSSAGSASRPATPATVSGVGGLGGERERLEHLEQVRVERVDRALHRRPDRRAGWRASAGRPVPAGRGRDGGAAARRGRRRYATRSQSTSESGGPRTGGATTDGAAQRPSARCGRSALPGWV